ncbi:MAG: hypothetical protein AAF597_21095, partial [Bacteroidota bacterium]
MDNPVSFESAGLTSVNELFERYKLGRSVIYKRIKDTGIKPTKIGVRAFVNSEQLVLLDSLHEFIQGGGTTAEFIFYRGLDPED